MTDTQNRVLSIDEVMALEEGARVYVEHGEPMRNIPDGVYAITPCEAGYARLYREIGFGFIGIEEADADYGFWFRVWSLPQPPTHEELNANPWEVQDEG